MSVLPSAFLRLVRDLLPATLAVMVLAVADWLYSPHFHDQAIGIALWWFFILWLGAVGGCVGSFLNVVWDRRGTERGIVFPPSHCEECGHSVRWYHNIPILSWLLLGGRCHDCGARIPAKHPIVEAVIAAMFITLGILTPWL